MPTGRVKWYDPGSREGVIEHAGRDHPVAEDDIVDEEAKTPGAPVEFDIQREGSRPNMVERAVDVTLREGKRPLRNKPPQDPTSPPEDR